MTGSDRDSARARAAWISADGAAPPDAVLDRFTTAGWRISLGAGATPVDLAVIDLGDRGVSSKAVEAMAATVRRAAPECVLVFRAGSGLAAAERAHLRRVGEFVPAEAGPQFLFAICRNRLRLRNIAEETGERLKSVAATARLAEFPPIECSAAAPSILVAGAPSPTALAAFTGADAAAAVIAGALTPIPFEGARCLLVPGLSTRDAAGVPDVARDIWSILSRDGLILYFLLYIAGGYLMYAVLFAAIGAFCETPRDAQTLMGPIMMLLIVPIFTMQFALRTPDALYVQILSWVPLFTPFLMSARIPSGGVGPVEIAATTAGMFAMAVFMVWIAGRAFRAGALSDVKLSWKTFATAVRGGR